MTGPTSQKPDRVLVVGGYGTVGTTVTRALAEWYPERVVVGGRLLERCRRTALANGAAGAAAVDVSDVARFHRVLDEHRIGTVVLCIEPPDPEIALACLERGVHVVDIGASYHRLAQVEGFADRAVEHGATAVLSVGVAPGLTNLMARRAHDALGGADRVDLTVLLGGGEKFGAGAVHWTVDQLAAPAGPVRKRTIELPGHGRRTAHPFAFPDQHSLRRTLEVPDVATRLCLDSAVLTSLLFGLRRTGVYRFARSPMIALLSRLHIGREAFVVRADAYLDGATTSFAATGTRQSRCTALVAAQVTRTLLDDGLPPGVHHIDELPALADVPERLVDFGLTVWPPLRLA